MPGGRLRIGVDQLHGHLAGRRVRQGHRRSLLGDQQLVRGRLPGGQLHVPGLSGPVRRDGDLHGDVGRVPGGRLRLCVDQLYGRLAGRRVRQRPGRSLLGDQQLVRGRLPNGQLHVPGLSGPVRRGGDLHGDVGRVCGEWLRLRVDQLYGRLAGRRVRQRRGRSLHGDRQLVRGRLPNGQLHVPGLGGPVRRGGDLHGDVGRVPGGRLRIGGDQLYGRLAGRRVRQRRGRSLHGDQRRVRGRLPGGQLHMPGLSGPVRRGGDLHGDVGRVPGGRLRIGVDQLYGRLAGRRVRQGHRRSLLGDQQLVRGRLPGGQLHVPGLSGPVRRDGDLHGDVGRVPGGRLRIGVNQLYGRLAGRRVRQRPGRSLLGDQQLVRGRLPGGQLHVPGLR